MYCLLHGVSSAPERRIKTNHSNPNPFFHFTQAVFYYTFTYASVLIMAYFALLLCYKAALFSEDLSPVLLTLGE